MGDYDAVSRAVQSSIEELGPIDILINNACAFAPTIESVL